MHWKIDISVKHFNDSRSMASYLEDDKIAEMNQGITLAIRRGDFPWLVKFFSSKRARSLPHELIQSYTVTICHNTNGGFSKLAEECGLGEILERLMNIDQD